MADENATGVALGQGCEASREAIECTGLVLAKHASTGARHRPARWHY
jgi:hypothetical protein